MAEGSAKPPRVCILIGTFFPVVGGGETHARLLGRELVRLGIPVTVVTRRTDRSLKRIEELDGVVVHRVTAPASPRLGKYAMLLPAMVRLVRLRREYDVIYVCALRVLGVVGVLAARLLGKRCVLRAEACGELSGDFIRQNFDSDDTPPPLPPLVRRVLRWRNQLYAKADSFLSISSLIEQEFKACGVPASKHCTIACGLDTDRFVPVDAAAKQRVRRELGMPDGFVFAYSGKLNRGKGLPVLLDAFQEVAQRHAHTHLVLVGGGADHSLSCEDGLREQVRALGLEERVTFTGYVANVEDYLHAADAFVFPSLKESFGLAPLEAMACALPTIATRVGELPHVLTDGRDGLLVDPGSRDALVQAMVRVCEDPGRAREMGVAGRATVVERLGIRRVAEAHAALFRDLQVRGER